MGPIPGCSDSQMPWVVYDGGASFGKGNMTQDRACVQHGYDEENRVVSVNDHGSTADYAYHGEGRRVSKSVAGVLTSVESDLSLPNCRSNRISPSHGAFDWLLRIFGRKPYWRQLCNTRFNFI